MKRKNIQLLLFITAIISLVLLIIIQISWVLSSARLREAQFNHTVNMAMNRMVENLSNNRAICEEMNSCVSGGEAHSCFMMMKNRVEWADLDSIIKSDLKYYDINLKYEFDIIKKGAGKTASRTSGNYTNDNLQTVLDESGYELRLSFPERSEFIKAQMGYIFVSSIALLLLVCGSFVMIYNYFKRERRLTVNIIDFINNITHEFKTPLTNISMANSLLSKNKIVSGDEKLSSYSRVIKNEQQRLKDKVDILLKAALSEKGSSFSHELFDAEAEIRHIINTFSIRLQESNGSISLNSSGENFILSGNVEMFQIAIGNLIDNAIRYNDREPVIEINLKSTGSLLRISISDNGKGIAREHYSGIFEKYYRISAKDVHDSQGFGLGLYFVKNTVKQMNGKIRVSSQLNIGTTFTLEFPIPVA